MTGFNLPSEGPVSIPSFTTYAWTTTKFYEDWRATGLPAVCLPPACRLPAACLPPACRLPAACDSPRTPVALCRRYTLLRGRLECIDYIIVCRSIKRYEVVADEVKRWRREQAAPGDKRVYNVAWIPNEMILVSVHPGARAKNLLLWCFVCMFCFILGLRTSRKMEHGVWTWNDNYLWWTNTNCDLCLRREHQRQSRQL